MKSYRNRLLATLAIALLAISAGVSRTVAQSISERGSFTLPYEVRWNDAVLPAGEYTFTMHTIMSSPVMTLDTPKVSTFLRPMIVDEKNTNQHSALTIESRGGERFVQELYLADSGRHFRFWPPKTSKSEPQLAQGPATTERVLVSIGK